MPPYDTKSMPVNLRRSRTGGSPSRSPERERQPLSRDELLMLVDQGMDLTDGEAWVAEGRS